MVKIELTYSLGCEKDGTATLTVVQGAMVKKTSTNLVYDSIDHIVTRPVESSSKYLIGVEVRYSMKTPLGVLHPKAFNTVVLKDGFIKSLT